MRCDCRRRPGDENLKPNQKLNAMLQRILKADYTFPPDKPLRSGPAFGRLLHAAWCSMPVHHARRLLSLAMLMLFAQSCRTQDGLGPPTSSLLPLLPDPGCSKEVRDLISRILVPNPDSRPTIKARKSPACCVCPVVPRLAGPTPHPTPRRPQTHGHTHTHTFPPQAQNRALFTNIPQPTPARTRFPRASSLLTRRCPAQ